MLSRDFKEFVELLNLNKVEYLEVGAPALAVHGHPRSNQSREMARVMIDVIHQATQGPRKNSAAPVSPTIYSKC